jgi:hypothetical protein
MTNEQVKLVETALQMMQLGPNYTVNNVPQEVRPILIKEYGDIYMTGQFQAVSQRLLRDAICRLGYFSESKLG